MRVANPLLPNDVVAGGPSSPKPQIEKGRGSEQRAGSASLPGDELPPAVYRTVIVAFAWMILAAWLAFGGATGTDLDLAVATVLCTVFLAIPVILRRTATNQLQKSHRLAKQFLESRVDIATGTVSGTEVWLQVVLIPVALALAATLIGGVYAVMS